MRPVTSRSSTGLPSMTMRPSGMAVAAHDAVEELAAAGAHQAIDAEDLAPAERQRDVVDRKAAGGARQGDVLGAEHLGADRMADRLGEVLGVRADHLADDPGDVDIRHALLAGDAPVAQHGDEVADADQLLQAMRDVDDGDAARLEVGDDTEEDFDLGGAQGRGRLVHDQDAGVLRHRLGDLDELLLADAQLLDRRARIDARLQALQQRAGPPFLLAMVDAEAAAGLSRARRRCFRRRTGCGKRLSSWKTMPMPWRDRLRDIAEGHRLAVEEDAPGASAARRRR